MRVFVTSEELSETHKISPHYYLRMMLDCKIVLCLLSKNFFSSNELFLELEVAQQANVSVMLVLEPSIKASNDLLNFEGIIHRWEHRFSGRAIDLAENNAEAKIVSRLCTELGIKRPSGWSPGKLVEQMSMAEDIEIVPSSELPLPDRDRLTSGNITLDNALKSLQILQKHMDNQARAVGVNPERVPSFAHVPELQLVLIFQATPIEVWPGIELQCSPLINNSFKHWVVHLLERAEGDEREKLMQMRMMCEH